MDPKKYTFNNNVNGYGQTWQEVFGNQAPGTGNASTSVTTPPAPPVVPPSVTTPSPLPTLGSIYDDPALGTALKQQGDYWGSVASGGNGGVDENAIRTSVLNSFQAEIDAQNALYAEKLRQAKIQGQNRIGQNTSVQARRGLLGSDFGNASTDTVIQGNNEIYQGIEDEKAAAISAILTKAKDNATAEIAAKRKAKEEGLNAYVTFLKESATRKQTNAKTAALLLLNGGQTIESMGDAALQQLLQGYGITKEQLQNEYTLAKTDFDAAKAKASMDGQFNLAPGEKRYDAKGNVIATGDPKAVSMSDKYGTGVIGEYNFYAEQEKAAGRVPMTFSAYQDADANRKLTSNTTITPGEIQGWVTYIQNGGKLTDVPAGIRTQVTTGLANSPEKSKANALKTQALTSAKDLLEKFNNGNTFAVGGSSLFGTLPGTKARDFAVQFDNLKSLLSLDNVSLLKGQGAVSDAERQLLADASAKLNRGQSEEEFKKSLESIIQGLSGPGETPAPPAVPPAGMFRGVGPDGNTYDVPLEKKAEWEAQGGKVLSFNQVGNTSASTGDNGVIAGYDIGSYASDPKHESNVRKIYNAVTRAVGDSVASIDSYIKRVAKNSPIKGEYVLAAAKRHGVDPKMIVALMQQDSAFGTRGKAILTYNPGNVGNDDTGRLVNYGSWENGVDAVAKNLAWRKIS